MKTGSPHHGKAPQGETVFPPAGLGSTESGGDIVNAAGGILGRPQACRANLFGTQQHGSRAPVQTEGAKLGAGTRREWVLARNLGGFWARALQKLSSEPGP